eukprot:m.339476 g.339476  ORF g.339476 m.339476 type:complete len:244 (-) comp18819_c0_seq1:73-804(-)
MSRALSLLIVALCAWTHADKNDYIMMRSMVLDAVKQPATAAVILMHGLGDSADGWKDSAAELQRRFVPHARFILPTAKVQPVTVNNGYACTSWYDIESLSSRLEEKATGLEDSRSDVDALIDKQIESGIPADRIIVAGFSQGGAMSLVTGLQRPQRLAGVISMSGYLVASARFNMAEEAKSTPVLMCHGTQDNVVRIEWGHESREAIKQAGASDVEFKEYMMMHSACPQEIQDVGDFMKKVIP